MGITIDKSRQLLSQYQKLFNSLNGDYKLSQVQISELSHSIGTALDTMRKYQKIEQIYKEWFSDIGRTSADAVTIAINTMRKYKQIEQILKDIPYGGEVTVRRIQEVVEDGDNT